MNKDLIIHKAVRPGSYAFAAYIAIFFVAFFLKITSNANAANISTPPALKPYQVKAVYIYNFMNFISWPKTENGDSKIIAILGESPLNQALQNLAATLEQKNRVKLKIINYGSYKSGMNLKNCQVLLINKSEESNFKSIFSALNNAPVLTISDHKNFIKAGGMIYMFKMQNRIRYSISRKAMYDAGLEPKSQLLNSAVNVNLK